MIGLWALPKSRLGLVFEMVWASSLLNELEDVPQFDSISKEMTEICGELLRHPVYAQYPEVVTKSVKEMLGGEEYESPIPFGHDGEGWFELHMGRSANEVVRSLRKARRQHKDIKEDIDIVIRSVRKLKEEEVDATLKSLGWALEHQSTIRNMGLSDKTLKTLRRRGVEQKDTLLRACQRWERADALLKTLEQHEGVWGEDEQKKWVWAMDERTSAKKSWSNTLNPRDMLNKSEQECMVLATEELREKGAMDAATILDNILGKCSGNLKRMLTARRLGLLFKMYGDEYGIMKGARRGEYILQERGELVLKEDEAWSYAAGFLDADGYISITGRGEPRAGFIATGDRGRAHCEALHKTLGCGVLQLDQKVYKDGQRSQHRLQFYSKDDMRKLLVGIQPHLRLKGMQAKAVLAFIDENDPLKKENLKRLVQYENWSDNETKSQQMLSDWGVNIDTVAKWRDEL